MNGKRKKNILLHLVAGTLFILLGSTSAKNTYYMDSPLDCDYIGLQGVGRDQTVMVHAKTNDTSSTTQLGCTINFQAVDNDATIRIDFESFIVNSCDVKLYISGDRSGSMSSYSCGDDPSMYSSIGRNVTLTLHKTKVTITEYNFRLKLIAVGDSRYPLLSDSKLNAVGLVTGSVGTVFGLIFIVACVGKIS